MQRTGRSSSLDRAGEKRPLERDGTNDGMPEEKRQRVPALASVIVEAVKMDSLQKLCSQLEPVLRRVVGEEVERALAKLVPAKLVARTSPKRIQGPNARNLRLQFRNKLALPLFTGSKVEGEQGSAIHVVLLDAIAGEVVTTGPEASAKLDVVVLEGDFGNDDDDDWTQEEFENYEVKEREGKRPLLSGELTVALKEGVGTLGEVTFTDNSSWIRSRKFRLGVKIASGFCEGVRIREAKTEAFNVKDHRGELYKKHYPPALNDEVWRLDKIGKDGAFHKKLNENNIRTVEDFLRLVVMDPQRLRNILGSGMSNKMWESTVEHAKTCVLSGKYYVYYTDRSHNIGVIFNHIYQLMGLIANQQYMSVESLTENEKVYVDKLVKVAYDNWSSVVEYDGEALISEKPNALRGIDSYTEDPITNQGPAGSNTQQATMLNQQAGLATQLVTGHQIAGAVGCSTTGSVQSYDYKQDMTTRYATQNQLPAESSHMLFGTDRNMMLHPSVQISSSTVQITSSTVHQNTMPASEAMTGLALGPPQSTICSGFDYQHGTFSQAGPANPSAEWARFKDPRGQEAYMPAGQIDDFFTEEDIRARSMEMLGDEEMQQLLRLYNASGGQLSGSYNIQGDDLYTIPNFSTPPNANWSGDRSKSSGKAYVGWLKLKAALRWGIFIRKIAAEKAEKRAQLVELEE
eukprot:c29161_g3_i1 orf=552-2612(-)